MEWKRHFEGLSSAPLPLEWQPGTRRMFDVFGRAASVTSMALGVLNKVYVSQTDEAV